MFKSVSFVDKQSAGSLDYNASAAQEIFLNICYFVLELF